MCLYSWMKAFIVHCTGNSMASQNIWCMWWLRAQLVVLKQVLKQDNLFIHYMWYNLAAKVLCPHSLLPELDCWFPDGAGKFAGTCRPPLQDPVLATCRWRLANVVHHASTPHCQSNAAPALPLTVPLSCDSFHLLFPRIQSSCAHCSWPRTRSQFGSPRPGTCQSCWPPASHQAANLTQRNNCKLLVWEKHITNVNAHAIRTTQLYTIKHVFFTRNSYTRSPINTRTFYTRNLLKQTMLKRAEDGCWRKEGHNSTKT